MGARLPRTAAGPRAVGALTGLVAAAGWSRGAASSTRRAAARAAAAGARARRPVAAAGMVATFPQLEYPRAARAWEHVVGPLLWEQPYGEVEPPPGDAPLVLVAPSTSQDPSSGCCGRRWGGWRARTCGCSPRRTAGRRPRRVDVPANARLVDWVSYAQTMPRCDVVVCHGGHGTVARALASGCAVVVVPGGRRHERERRAGGLGGRRRAPAAAALRPRAGAARGASARWPSRGCARGRASSPPGRRSHEPPARASELIEDLAG